MSLAGRQARADHAHSACAPDPGQRSCPALTGTHGSAACAIRPSGTGIEGLQSVFKRLQVAAAYFSVLTSHFFMNEAFAAPCSLRPFLSTALVAQIDAAGEAAAADAAAVFPCGGIAGAATVAAGFAGAAGAWANAEPAQNSVATVMASMDFIEASFGLIRQGAWSSKMCRYASR